MISFKASFKGRVGRAVTKSKRKRIPDLDRKEAKSTTTMLFSFEKVRKSVNWCLTLLKKGMRKVLSSEEECSDLEGT